MLTRICWSLAELVSRLLDPPEREVVRGDLTESGARPGRALLEVLGLVLRRQAAAWFDWRPWFTLASVVIPIGFLLSHASRWWGVTTAIDFANYWVLWDFSYLAYPGYRYDVIRMAVWIGAAWIFVVSPRLVRTFLVTLPMVWGAYRGSRGAALPLGPTLLGVLLLAGASLLISQSLERSVVFGRGLVPQDPGPDGFVVSADDPRPWWPLSVVMMWPAAYVLAISTQQRWRGRVIAAR